MGKSPIDLSSVTTVGLDLAKHVFFVHAVDGEGQVVIAKEVRRRDLLSFFASLPACLVGVEACSSAHHWGRELMALGHNVRLMPPAYVKPYVKRQKNDAADAAAICEAVTRPSMRFVKVRSIDNQAVLMPHKARFMAARSLASCAKAMRPSPRLWSLPCCRWSHSSSNSMPRSRSPMPLSPSWPRPIRLRMR